MVQAVHEEVAVRQVAIAVSAVIQMKRKTKERKSLPVCLSGDGTRGGNCHVFALTKYGKGLSALRKLLSQKDRRSLETALICAVLCIWFEVLTNDHLTALEHLNTCLRIIPSIKAKGKSNPPKIYFKVQTNNGYNYHPRQPRLEHRTSLHKTRHASNNLHRNPTAHSYPKANQTNPLHLPHIRLSRTIPPRRIQQDIQLQALHRCPIPLSTTQLDPVGSISVRANIGNSSRALELGIQALVFVPES